MNSLTLSSTLFVIFVSLNINPSLETAPLYNENDDVISLSTDSYDDNVIGSRHAWLMEFYSSWCGHCVRFAPIYKQLASDCKGWRDVISVGAVDCAQEENGPICRYYNVAAYPTIKLLPAYTVERPNGTLCGHVETTDKLRHLMINYLNNVSQSNIDSAAVVALQPMRDMNDIWSSVQLDSQIAIIIFEEQKSYLGREVILDMWGYRKQMVVRRMLQNDASKFGISQFPSMFSIDKSDGTFKKLNNQTDRDDFVRTLKLLSKFHSPKHNISPIPSIPFQNTRAESHEKSAVDRHLDLRSKNYLQLHEQDLEASLHYSLRHEIALRKSIDGEQLSVLKSYINALAQYLPVRLSVSSFLKLLNELLQKESGPLSSSDWLAVINTLQTESSYLPETTKWTGCVGSQSQYRGYPCSLWMVFHALTVGVASSHRTDRDLEARKTLIAIRGYVQHFFGCEECSKNFMKGAVHIENRVQTAEDAVLFLWRSHNKANFHLRGDLTEDPTHPKLQFPTVEQCRTCHRVYSNGSVVWIENQVFSFLKAMYGRANIVEDVFFEQSSNERLRRNDSQRYMTSSYMFDKVDIGLCVIFYFVCTGILVLIYFHFMRRRNSKVLNACFMV